MPNPIDATDISLGLILVVVWLLLATLLFSIIKEGAPQSGEGRYSRGWAMLWTWFLATACWLIVALLLFHLAAPGGLVIFFLAVAATIGSFFMLGEAQGPRWANASSAAIPLVMLALVAIAALSGQWQHLRSAILVIATILWVVAAVSAVSARFAHLKQQKAISVDRGWRLAQLEKTIQDMVGINQRIVQNISESQPMRNLIPLLDTTSGVSGEAMAAFKKLNRRQADLEDMLADPKLQNIAIQLLPQLELTITPRLTELVNAWCTQAATRTRPGGDDVSGSFIFFALSALHWMHEHNADCKEGLMQLKAAASEGLPATHREPADRQRLIEELDGMLK
jgi:hypothetical protein